MGASLNNIQFIYDTWVNIYFKTTLTSQYQ